MKQKDLQDSAKRAALGKLSGLVGIVCNVGLAGSKLAVGKLAGSMSITADGLNNLSDAASSIVTLTGFKLQRNRQIKNTLTDMQGSSIWQALRCR